MMTNLLSDNVINRFFTGFLLVLRNHGELSHRGPLIIIVNWIALALLCCVWLRTNLATADNYHYNWPDDGILVSLHFLYFLSLIPKGSATYVQRRTRENNVGFFCDHIIFSFSDFLL